MKKSELVKELESYGYCIYKPSNLRRKTEYSLYRKGYGYRASIDFNKGNVKFNGTIYNSVKELIDAVESYVEKLEFRPETYDPDAIDKFIKEVRIHDTYKKCGLKNPSYCSDNYVLDGVLGSRLVTIAQDCIVISDNSYIPLFDESADYREAVDSIKGILAADYAANIAILVAKLNEMGHINTIKDIKVKTINMNYSVTEVDGKKGIIELLENTLKLLKE